jgi:hypothetical protein
VTARFVSLVLVLAGPAAIVHAADGPGPVQPGPWQLSCVSGLNLSQSSFSEDWAGGDKGSIVWVLNSDAKAERQFNVKYNLSNHLQLTYGQTIQQQADPADPGRLVWASPRKSNDLVVFESVSRFTLGGWVDPYAALRLDSQFRDESSPLGAIALSPLKFTESAGVAKVLQKTEEREWITRVGFGFRQNLARQFDPGTGQKVRVATNDGGFEWQTTATQPLLQKKVLYKGQLRVFQPVFFGGSSALEQFDRDARAFEPGREAIADFWRAPGVDFQNVFTAQITSLLSVNLAVQWVYLKFDPATKVDNSRPIADRIAAVDHGVRKRGQYREALAIGLTYRLF